MNPHLNLNPDQWDGPGPQTDGRADLQVVVAGEPVDGWCLVEGWWHPADESGPVRATDVWGREDLLAGE